MFRDIETQAFKAAKDDGLWDVLLGSFVGMFAVGPLLSRTMGDFWSAALFLPVWLAVYLATRLLRERVLRPRIGSIEIGAERRRSLTRASTILLAVNVVALLGGVLALVGFGSEWLGIDELVYPVGLGLVALIGGVAAAWTTRIWRFAAYGLMLAVAPIIGEWLWQNGYASHHGYPVTFGASTVVILAVGIARFTWLLRSHPLPKEARII